MSQNRLRPYFFLLNNHQRRCITIFKKFSQHLRRGTELTVTKILKSCTHLNSWFTLYSMSFSVILCRSNPCMSRCVIQLTDYGVRAPVLTMTNLNWITQSWMWYVTGCTYGVLMYCNPVNYLGNNMVSLFDELKKNLNILLQDDIPQLL